MAAANTDKFRKGFFGAPTTLSAPISDSATTIPLSDTTGYPTDTAIDIVINRVDANGTPTPAARETLTVVISGNNGTNAVRGVESTAKAHAAGSVVEILLTAATHDDMVDGILADHDQQGRHKQLTDTNGNVLLALGATASAVNRLKASNAATGNAPMLEAEGSNTNIDLKLKPKGTGMIVMEDTPARLGAIHRYTFDGTDIHVDGVDQNNGGNTISWAKPANLKFAIVEVVGGGGGGGGAASSPASNSAVGGGGGAGGYSLKKILAASLGSTETVTVGAAGAGATAGNNSGGNGGTSSFGSHCSGAGGNGGSGMQAESGNRVAAGGTGGAGSNGDLNVTGQHGSTGRVHGGWPFVAPGGNSLLGNGGVWATGGGAAGVAGSGHGSGGSGGVSFADSTARAGGAGAGGIVIVYEYY